MTAPARPPPLPPPLLPPPLPTPLSPPFPLLPPAPPPAARCLTSAALSPSTRTKLAGSTCRSPSMCGLKKMIWIRLVCRGIFYGKYWGSCRRRGCVTAAMVSRGWREMTRSLWRAAEELRIRVPAWAQVGFVSSILQKCPGIVTLSLKMERSVVNFFFIFNLNWKKWDRKV